MATDSGDLSRLSVPRIRTTVAVLQDYGEPESFSVVDFALSLRLCKLDRQACHVLSLIDGRRSIQEIADKAASLTGTAKTGQESLQFFKMLRSRLVLEF